MATRQRLPRLGSVVEAKVFRGRRGNNRGARPEETADGFDVQDEALVGSARHGSARSSRDGSRRPPRHETGRRGRRRRHERVRDSAGVPSRAAAVGRRRLSGARERVELRLAVAPYVRADTHQSAQQHAGVIHTARHALDRIRVWSASVPVERSALQVADGFRLGQNQLRESDPQSRHYVVAHAVVRQPQPELGSVVDRGRAEHSCWRRKGCAGRRASPPDGRKRRARPPPRSPRRHRRRPAPPAESSRPHRFYCWRARRATPATQAETEFLINARPTGRP